MLGKKFFATIVKFSHTTRSLKNKIAMMLFGAINLPVVIPFVFFRLGVFLKSISLCIGHGRWQ